MSELYALEQTLRDTDDLDDASIADIHSAIRSISRRHSYQPYAARDFGSRATGLDDPSSDRDILLLIDNEPTAHKLGTALDATNEKINGYDFQIWSTSFFHEKLTETNPTAIEFLQSELQYFATGYAEQALDAAAEMARESFSPHDLCFHYKSLCKDNWSQYIKNGNDPTYKRAATIAHAYMRADWIANEDHDGLPPLTYDALLDQYDESSAARPLFMLFANRKRNMKGDQELTDSECVALQETVEPFINQDNSTLAQALSAQYSTDAADYTFRRDIMTGRDQL